jgi:hypothetical protein
LFVQFLNPFGQAIHRIWLRFPGIKPRGLYDLVQRQGLPNDEVKKYLDARDKFYRPRIEPQPEERDLWASPVKERGDYGAGHQA